MNETVLNGRLAHPLVRLAATALAAGLLLSTAGAFDTEAAAFGPRLLYWLAIAAIGIVALEVLHRAFPHAVPGAEGRVADLPVFSNASGAFVGRYAREAIEAAQRLPETPRLTAAQVEALDLLDAVCAEPGLALRLEVRPGDVLLFNPLQVWKRRAEAPAEPTDAEGAARQALRLLLLTPTSRALPQGLVTLGAGTTPAQGGGADGGMVGG